MSNILRVGTDCSGIEAPIQALKKLKIPFHHVFSSDIDKYVIQSIKVNYKPDIIYGDKDGLFPNGDITERDNKTLPDIDLYVCGFPCQTFSHAGKRAGLNDKRGIVFWSCLDVIKTKKPKYFLLENVKGLISHDKGTTWEIIWGEIKKLEKYGYNVYWKVLNTKDYGIPQNRERIFIVGTKDEFKYPNHCKMKHLKTFIDLKDNIPQKITSKNLEKYILKHKDNLFLELQHCNFDNNQNINYSACITANTRLWCVYASRLANVKELLKLQGFPITIKQVVSDTQMKKQIGNSMSVNVVSKIFKALLV